MESVSWLPSKNLASINQLKMDVLLVRPLYGGGYRFLGETADTIYREVERKDNAAFCFVDDDHSNKMLR
jgi:hypothetical protein